MSGAGDVYPLLTGEDLAAMPAPACLVEGVVLREGLTVVYGASGAGKSFLALDLALCVATGTPWLGRPVESGWVVYIVAEGLAGFGARYRAWTAARGVEAAPRFRVLPEAVNLLDGALVAKLQRTLRTLPEPPALVAVDTVARSMVGGDENSAQDVGRVIDAVDSLAPRGARLAVHHAGHEADRERGSSALRAAADMVIRVTSEDASGARVTASCAKAKDLAPFAAVPLRLAPSGESMVLAVREDAVPARADDLRGRVLAALAEMPTPASQNAVREAAGANKQAVARTLRELAAEGLVAEGDGGWSLVPEGRNHPAQAELGDGTEAVPPLVPERSDPPGTTGPGNGGAVVPVGGGPLGPPAGTAPEPTCTCPAPVGHGASGRCERCGWPVAEEGAA